MIAGRKLLALLGSYLGTILLGGLVAYVLTSDFQFSAAAERGDAVVVRVSPSYRSGSTLLTVEQSTDHGRVPGEIECWYWQPREGEIIPTLYAPDRPSRPVVDRFWTRHGRSVTALAIFLVVSAGEAATRRSHRQSEALDHRMATEPVLDLPPPEVVFID